MGKRKRAFAETLPEASDEFKFRYRTGSTDAAKPGSRTTLARDHRCGRCNRPTPPRVLRKHRDNRGVECCERCWDNLPKSLKRGAR